MNITEVLLSYHTSDGHLWRSNSTPQPKIWDQDSGNPDFTSGLFRCCFYGIKYHNIYKKYIFCSVHLTIYIIISISIRLYNISPGVVPYWLSGRNQIGILTCRLTNDQLQHALMSLWIVSDGLLQGESSDLITSYIDTSVSGLLLDSAAWI
jgi:hypothetical protein